MRVFIALLSLLITGGNGPQVNYSVEIYLLANNHSNLSDSISKELTIKKEDLPIVPFINDDEIEHFDTSNYRITFSREAAKRIGALKPSLSVGIPFVLTVDREPILSGYFVNIVSSFGCGAYVLSNTPQQVQELRKGLPEYYYKAIISENRKNHFLIQALERTGRLK